MQFEGFIEIKPKLFYKIEDHTCWTNNINGTNQYKTFTDNVLHQLKTGNVSNYINTKYGYWHRLVYEFFKGPIPSGLHIDHYDNNPLNNNPNNLFLTNNKNNSRKCLKKINNKSKFPGVIFIEKRKKWQAGISINCKYVFLGYFDDPQEAFVCYLENKIYYHGWDSILPII